MADTVLGLNAPGDPTPAEHPGMAELGELLAAMDYQVRQSALRAHCALLEDVAKIQSLTIGDVTIPREALLPADLHKMTKIAFEFEVFLRNNGASLSKTIFKGGTSAKICMEWEAAPAPEATALVRTKAETVFAKQIQHG